jgi:4-cresol dehydrogenase (hydroxylating)
MNTRCRSGPSRGAKTGYGTAAPRMAGSVVLDMGRMNRILELDPKLAYAVVEPGVGFFDLHDEVERQKARCGSRSPATAGAA